jgi:GT2 family glycosyltransferase
LTVSVVIPAYRSGGALLRCLRALATADGTLEVLVVDNGEDERELGEAEGLPGVEVVRPGANLGFAAGCNLGAERSSGDRLVFMNQDTVAEPAAVRALAAVLDDPEIGVATARLRLLEQPELLNSYGTVMHLSGLAWAGGYGEPAETVGTVREAPFPSGAAMAIRSELFHELGRFTEELFMYCEDLELGWRARLRGLRIVVTPAADVLHEYEFARNPGKEYLIERNRLVLVLTGYPLRLLVLVLPVLVAAELALLALALKQGWAKEKLRGWGWCLRRPRWLARHRRETQRLKRVRARDVARVLSPVIDPQVLATPPGLGVANRLMSLYWSLARRAL